MHKILSSSNSSLKNSFKDKVRVLIHSLKMHSLLNVEEDMAHELRKRIALLPSVEKISSMSHEELMVLKKYLNNLILDLDEASNIRSNNRALYETFKKGIPPFRQPLL